MRDKNSTWQVPKSTCMFFFEDSWLNRYSQTMAQETQETSTAFAARDSQETGAPNFSPTDAPKRTTSIDI